MLDFGMAVKQKSGKHGKKAHYPFKQSKAGAKLKEGKQGIFSTKGGKFAGLSIKGVNTVTGTKIHDHIAQLAGLNLLTNMEGGQGAPVSVPSEALDEASLANELISEIDQNGTDVRTLCDDYGLKREELGRLTGFSLRALAEWAAKKVPSQPAQRRLRELRRLLDALSEIVDKQAIPEWLHKRNPAFENMTPLQVIELGEIDRIWGMIYQMSSSQPE